MEKKVVKKVPVAVRDLLFKKFKKSLGIKVFVVKYSGEKEKTIYNDALTILKGEGYLSYTINFSSIQIFLTDIGRKIADEKESW